MIENENKSNEYEQLNIKVNKKHLKIMVIGVLCTIGIIIMTMIASGQSEEEYKKKISNISNEMLTVASKCEKVINVYSKGWKAGIDSRNFLKRVDIAHKTGLDYGEFIDNTTNPGNGSDGEEKYIAYSGDFDSVLNYLGEYYENTGTNKEIVSLYDAIESNIKELKKAPKDLAEEYEMLMEMSIILKNLVNKTIYLEGSYKSYTESTDDLKQDFLNKFNMLDLKISQQK